MTTKTSLIVSLLSLAVGCNGLSTPASQAVTVPSSPCDTAGPAVLQGALTLIVTAPRSLVSGTVGSARATAIDINGATTDVTNEVTWSSTNFLAASADSGKLYAIGVGSATIRATLGEIVGSASVDILPITLESLSLDAESEIATAGALTVWRVTGHYNDGSTVDLTATARWSSSDSTVAVIEHAGQVRATSAGMAMISATVDGQLAAAPLMVTTATLTGVRIDSDATYMSASGQKQLTATGIYSDGSESDLTGLVAWSTSDSAIATVSQGRVQGVSAGNVTITVSSGSFSGSIVLSLQ